MVLTQKLLLIGLLAVIIFVGVLSLTALGPDPSRYEPEDPIQSGAIYSIWCKRTPYCDPMRNSDKKKITCTLGGMEQCSATYCN